MDAESSRSDAEHRSTRSARPATSDRGAADLKASPLPPAPFDSCGLAGYWFAGLQLAGRLAGSLAFWLACWLACLLTLTGRTCRTGRGLDQNSCLFVCLFTGNCFLNISAEMCYFL